MSLIRKANGTICSTNQENIGKTIVFEGEIYFVASNGRQRHNEFSLYNILNKGNIVNNEYTINDELKLPINNIVVSHVIKMHDMFKNCEQFNQPLNNWDVSVVTDMSNMFEGSKQFNQSLNNWYVYEVKRMGAMFKNW